jgi:hypothetical protein
MLITSVLFGMRHSENFLKQSQSTQRPGIGTNVEMIFLDFSFRELLFYQLTMRSSKWFNVLAITFLTTQIRCYMGVNRGIGCKEPCPVCHVPDVELHDCGKARWPLQTGVETQEIIDRARQLSATEGEALLKANGLCPIEVCSNLCFTLSLINVTC